MKLMYSLSSESNTWEGCCSEEWLSRTQGTYLNKVTHSLAWCTSFSGSQPHCFPPASPPATHIWHNTGWKVSFYHAQNHLSWLLYRMFHFAVILSFFQFTNSVVDFLDLFQQLCLLFLKFLSGSFSNLPSPTSFPIAPFSLVRGMCLIICFVCFFSGMQRIVPSMFYQF